MKYKAYPKYKKSGVEWLGDVPEGWEVNKVGYSFQAKKGKKASLYTKEYCELIKGEYPVYSGQTENNGILSRINEFEFDAKFEGYLFSTTVGAKAMSISHLKGKFSLSQNCMVIIPTNKNIIIRFYYYHFQPKFTYERKLIPEHMQASFRMEDLYSYKFAIPPLKEQQKIASYLDQKTQKIETLIAKQQELIELLKEKRQALISHVVTKGLDNSVTFKDSGIAWLGKIPEGWDVKRLKYLFEIKKRISGEEGFSVLSITQNGIKVKDIKSGSGQLSMDYSKYQFVEIGDFAMNHMDLLTGYVDVSNYYGVTSPDYRVFSIRNQKYVKKYFLYLLQMGYKNKIFYAFGQGSSQLGRWRLPTNQFYNFIFPIPPQKEQKQIANYLDQKTTQIDTLIDKSIKSIELLKEKKRALISAVVTGKIDVRDEV